MFHCNATERNTGVFFTELNFQVSGYFDFFKNHSGREYSDQFKTLYSNTPSIQVGLQVSLIWKGENVLEIDVWALISSTYAYYKYMNWSQGVARSLALNIDWLSLVNWLNFWVGSREQKYYFFIIRQSDWIINDGIAQLTWLYNVWLWINGLNMMC